MKTVSGTVVSSKAVSLSKAARILSKFALSDNGAVPAFAAYLKRASASFNELVQLHKEFKGSGSDRKVKKQRSAAVLDEETMNSVKGCSETEDGLLTEEKQWSSGSKKHKGGRRGEGEARELEGSLMNDGETQKQKVKRESDDAIVDNVGQDGNRDTKNKIEKVKENADGASNRIASESERLDEGQETKAKKKRDKGKKENLDGDLKIEEEQKSCPPNEDAVNQKATKKHNKKKRIGQEEKESGSIVGSEQKYQSGGDDGSVDGFRTVKNQLDIESGEGKKHKKKQNHEGEERKGESKVEGKEANDNVSRKRKQKGDSHGGLDNSEEQHRPKKKKK